jgi:hypothetical protein
VSSAGVLRPAEPAKYRQQSITRHYTFNSKRMGEQSSGKNSCFLFTLKCFSVCGEAHENHRITRL